MGADPPHLRCAPNSPFTDEDLIAVLAELEAVLYRRFPACAADDGLDVAKRVGLRYVERTRAGLGCNLSRPASYLRVTAFRAARRRCQRELRTVPIDSVDIPTAWGVDAGEEPGPDAVLAAMDGLPARQQQAIVLHVIRGFSLREAASEMGGIRHQSVADYVKAGLARLRVLLSKFDKTGIRAAAAASCC